MRIANHGRNLMTRSTYFTALSAAILMVGCLAGCPNDPTIFDRNAGLRDYDNGNIDQAEKIFTRSLEDNPSDWLSMWYLAKIRIRQNRAFEARVMLEKALALRGNNVETPDILDDLAEATYRENDPSQLATMLQSASTRYTTPRDFLRQAKYLGLVGDVDGAKLAYKKLIRFTGPKDPAGYIAMANYLETVGDPSGALLSLRKAYYINPNDSSVADRLRKYGIAPGPTAGIEPPADDFKPTVDEVNAENAMKKAAEQPKK